MRIVIPQTVSEEMILNRFSTGEVKMKNMKGLTQAELEARALIAGDLLKEGEVTMAETFRVEVDALLGENTGDLKFEKNEDFKKGEM